MGRGLGRRPRPAAANARPCRLVILVALARHRARLVLAIVIRMAISRTREYVADAGSVELTKNPDAMISALRKIEGRGEIPSATSAVMEMCIDNPREGFSNIFDTHPSVDKRVEALVKFAGGHDPRAVGDCAAGRTRRRSAGIRPARRWAVGAGGAATDAYDVRSSGTGAGCITAGSAGRSMGADARLMSFE